MCTSFDVSDARSPLDIHCSFNQARSDADADPRAPSDGGHAVSVPAFPNVRGSFLSLEQAGIEITSVRINIQIAEGSLEGHLDAGVGSCRGAKHQQCSVLEIQTTCVFVPLWHNPNLTMIVCRLCLHPAAAAATHCSIAANPAPCGTFFVFCFVFFLGGGCPVSNCVLTQWRLKALYGPICLYPYFLGSLGPRCFLRIDLSLDRCMLRVSKLACINIAITHDAY